MTLDCPYFYAFRYGSALKRQVVCRASVLLPCVVPLPPHWVWHNISDVLTTDGLLNLDPKIFC